MAILILAIFLMAIGSFGTGAAVVLEMQKREPIYLIMMKVFPWFFALGAVLLSVALH